MKALFKKFVSILRELTTDDAYERYRNHQCAVHGNAPLMDRRAFYIKQQQEKWNGIKRCC